MKYFIVKPLLEATSQDNHHQSVLFFSHYLAIQNDNTVLCVKVKKRKIELDYLKINYTVICIDNLNLGRLELVFQFRAKQWASGTCFIAGFVSDGAVTEICCHLVKKQTFERLAVSGICFRFESRGCRIFVSIAMLALY